MMTSFDLRDFEPEKLILEFEDAIERCRNDFPSERAIGIAIILKGEGWRMRGGINAMANYIVRLES